MNVISCREAGSSDLDGPFRGGWRRGFSMAAAFGGYEGGVGFCKRGDLLVCSIVFLEGYETLIITAIMLLLAACVLSSGESSR